MMQTNPLTDPIIPALRSITLLDGGSMELRNWARFSRFQLSAAGCLDRVLQTGTPIDLFTLMQSEEDRLIHQRAMAETAKPASDWIAENVLVRHGALRMLDIGGSHGVYSAAICRRNPPMRSTVYELPHMVSLAETVAAETGADPFCDHIGEDFLEATVDSDYDLAFLGNLIHHFDNSAANGLIAKIHAALKPGGIVAIWDLEQQETSNDPAAALFSLLFYISSNAKCYTREDIRSMLDSAGFHEFRQIRPPVGSTHCLYVASKPIHG